MWIGSTHSTTMTSFWNAWESRQHVRQ